jgi:hypothetical protein
MHYHHPILPIIVRVEGLVASIQITGVRPTATLVTARLEIKGMQHA